MVVIIITMINPMLQIKFFQLVGGCETDFEASELCRRHIENQLQVHVSVGGWLRQMPKNSGVFINCVHSDGKAKNSAKKGFQKQKVMLSLNAC